MTADVALSVVLNISFQDAQNIIEKLKEKGFWIVPMGEYVAGNGPFPAEDEEDES